MARESEYKKGSKAFSIIGLQVFEKPGVAMSELHHRNYQVSGTDKTVEAVKDLVYNEGVHHGNHITEGVIAREVPELITMSSVSNGGVYIPNGWNEARFSFVLTIGVKVSPIVTDVFYIQGYSDFHDPLLNMKSDMDITEIISSDTTFYINSYTRVEVVKTGGTSYPTIKEKVNVITKDNGTTGFEFLDSNGEESEFVDALEMARPYDIVEELYFEKAYSNHGSGADVQNKPVTSDRSNAGSLGYMTEIINATISGKNVSRESSIGGEDSGISLRERNTATMKDVTAELATPSTVTCPFIYALYTRHRDINKTTFSINDLLYFEPDIDDISTFYSSKIGNVEQMKITERVNEVAGTNIIDSNNVSDTSGNYINTRLAVEFINLIGSFMMDNLVTKSVIAVSNDPTRYRGEIATAMDSGSIFNNIFATEKAENAIEEYLLKNVLRKLAGEDFKIDIVASINLVGISTVAIAVNCEREPEVFRFNTSADSLYSPHIATITEKNSIISSMGSIVDIINEAN